MTQPPSHIYLIGFMGSGKSTVAALLGVRLQRPCIDLDARIVASARSSIAEIFRSQGEERFRTLETEALRALASAAPAVVATGGGVVGREENWQLMRASGLTVYLQADWETLQQRLQGSKERPLAQPELGWEPVRKLLQERLPLYARADLTIATAGLQPQGVAEEIVSRLATITRQPWNA